MDLRRRDCLDARTKHSDHGEWTSRAASGYRDEIVHLGAQLLNDCEIRPWGDPRARLAYAKYLEAAREYDKNPEAWEAAYWSALRRRLPSGLRKKLDRREH